MFNKIIEWLKWLSPASIKKDTERLLALVDESSCTYDLKEINKIKRQLGNVLFWNGSQDEIVSSHIGRRIKAGKATWFDKKLCCLLKKIENNHCAKSLGE